MDDFGVHIYSSGDTLPEGLLTGNFFHSRSLFEVSRHTPRHRPYMVTVEDGSGGVAAQMLALVRYRSSWMPPYFYMHCRVLGEGCYRQEERKDELFGQMLHALKDRMGYHVLYIEVSNISQKMFGYSQFRSQGFFPVRWMSIHNSLHSRQPEERIGPQLMARLQAVQEKGVTVSEADNDADFHAFTRLLHRHNWLKPKRYVPADDFFLGAQQTGNVRLFVTKYHGHVIGCSAIAYSKGQAYLWYSAFRRKSFAPLHPADITIWHAIKDSYERGYEHIFFMDVGLPLRKNRFRDFILSFGGKPVSTYRWFAVSIGWMNRLLSWIFRES
jgi:hypothetical protein